MSLASSSEAAVEDFQTASQNQLTKKNQSISVKNNIRHCNGACVHASGGGGTSHTCRNTSPSAPGQAGPAVKVFFLSTEKCPNSPKQRQLQCSCQALQTRFGHSKDHATLNFLFNTPPGSTRSESGLGIDPNIPVLGGLPFHGVRVIDLSTVLAGPVAARAMADLGAEVIKVEEAAGGDPFRKTFCEYEPGRAFGSAFEMANLGKASVALDLKSAGGQAALRRLLGDADVLVTNVRPAALARLGLDAAALTAAFPQLVVCCLSAYGAAGPDAGAPGYDVGAFWAASGMAAAVQPPSLHGVYPAGFGDITTARCKAAPSVPLFFALVSIVTSIGTFSKRRKLHAVVFAAAWLRARPRRWCGGAPRAWAGPWTAPCSAPGSSASRPSSAAPTRTRARR